MSELPAIGSKILVDFPRQALKDIPAKVDTGAYTSSVWASNFKEKNGVLKFTLFAPESPFYTGDVISATDYRIRPVKSSFGHSELRYMVNLRIKIDKKIINASFSLADRSANRYPVLIGRRTIKGKYVVDVTKNMVKDSYSILVLDYKSIGSVTRFFERIHETRPKFDFTLATHSDLIFQINDNKTRVILTQTGKDVADFDMVFIKSVMADKPVVVALAKYLEISGTPYMDKANAFYPLNNKLAQYIELQAKDIPVPKSIFIAADRIKDRYTDIVDYLGVPFVLKDIAGSKGRDNHLINNAKQFKKATKQARKKELNMIAQEYIENTGDYRVLIFGRQVQLVIHRQKGDGTHLNNTSAGGTAKLVDESVLPKDVKKMSVDAAELLRLDVAGVDMMQAKKGGAWYCLEVNHGPQITSGSFVLAKQAKFGEFLRKRLERGV